MKVVTLEGTQELMRQREVAVILATGGLGLVRAAYSAGKPAYGVGPGNAPAYIERTADLAKAVRDIITGKTFDYGVLCSSENSVVVDEAVAAEVRAQFTAHGGHFLSAPDAEAVARVLVTPQRLPSPDLVGRSAMFIAEKAGISVPQGTRVLLAHLDGVGRDYPLSMEKLCPVLSFYVVKDWREGCERCKQILRYGGMGHTMAIHSRDEAVILQFGLHKPAFRIVVNTPTTLGSIGFTTGLDPAMTLGCGGYGGNITSDNISPMHLLNVKRLAYEVTPVQAEMHPAPRAGAEGAAWTAPRAGVPPAGPAGRERTPLPASVLHDRVDAFLQARGYRADGGPAAGAAAPTPPTPAGPRGGPERGGPRPVEELDFVAEEDVRRAVARGVRIRLAPRAIVTPAARDFAAAHDVFVTGQD
jgi:acetaldehyde dehydrogenase (acetylating)